MFDCCILCVKNLSFGSFNYSAENILHSTLTSHKHWFSCWQGKHLRSDFKFREMDVSSETRSVVCLWSLVEYLLISNGKWQGSKMNQERSESVGKEKVFSEKCLSHRIWYKPSKFEKADKLYARDIRRIYKLQI